MAEFLVAGLAWGALKLTSSIVSAGFKKLASAGVNRLIGGEEEDAAMVEWSGDIVLKAREKAAGVTTRPTQMAPASRAVEGLQQEVRGGMATLSRDLHSGLGTMGAAAAAEIAGVRSEVRGVKRDLAVVRASVEECRAENMEFFESFTANLESAQESIAIMRSAPLHEADMALKNFEASRGNVRFLETAHSKAMTALVQGHTLDVKLSAGIIAIAAGYVYMSKTDSPSDAKYFTVNGTLSNIVQHFAPIWADPSVAGTPDGKKTLSFLLNLVSCVCVLPADDVPVLPRLDKRLLPAFGALCAAEPELRRLYPAVAGAAVRAMLESKSMKGLFQLADEIDVDAEDCTSKDAVVQALLTSGKSLVPMVPAVSAPVRDAGTDRAALMAFHKATGGPSWESKRGWGTSARLCDWYGVKVDFEGRVVELKLCDNSLAGSIPRELGGLSKLKKLWLSKNKLNGTIPPELGNLAALTDLNLFGNHLSGPIPPEVGKLAELKELWLGNNQLTGPIPPELGKLAALKKLWLGRNQLTGAIPPELGTLTALVTLELQYNQLSGPIPQELGNLAALEHLGLKYNKLSGPIPKELGALSKLITLHLRFNKLTGPIPPELGALRELKTLALNNNQLTALWDHTQDVHGVGHEEGTNSESGGPVPSQLRRLLDVFDRCENLFLSSNSWAEPPESIVSEGPKNIRGYFEDLYAEPCRIQRNSIKIILVGQEGAGKTSLRQSMKANKAAPTGDWREESTVFADVETMELEGASVRVYDCAGQVAYTGLLQMFLTPRSVCVLVCNAGAFEQQQCSGADTQKLADDVHLLGKVAVLDWLRSISQRVPENDVILVATKCDLASRNADQVGKRIEHACRTWLASWVRDGMQPVRVEDGVSLTSCCSTAMGRHGKSSTGKHEPEGGWPCDWRENTDDKPTPSLLHRLVNKRDGGGLRGAQMVLPHSWDIALTVLDALELGRNPVEVVMQKLDGPDGEEATEMAQPQGGVYQGIKVEELNAKWQETVVELAKRDITVTNAKNALEGALSIREFEGSLVRHEMFVFLDVVWLARILKPLLNHKDEENFDGFVNIGDTGDARITLEAPSDIASWHRLKSEGILEPRLARVIWPVGLSEYVLPTLASLGLTFPLENDPAEGLVVLLSLKPGRPERVGEVVDTFSSKHTPALSASWKMFLGVPPGAIEKVLTRCCSLGGVRTFWRSGVLVHGGLGDQDESGLFAVVLQYSSSGNKLTAQVYGDISSPAPWVALSYVISAVRSMRLDFPGLRSRGSLECPQHGDAMPLADTATRAGDNLLLENAGCPQCSPETMGQGAAAVELLRMVDIRLDRGVIFHKVKERVSDLTGRYPFFRPSTNPHQESEREMFREVKVSLDQINRGVDQTNRGVDQIKRSVDRIGVGVQESLMRLKNLQAPNYSYPHLVVVKELETGGTPLRAQGMRRVWNKVRGMAMKDMTLHFLCPVDMSKVPCGVGGEGYRFRETRGWVKKLSPVLQVVVVTAKVALKATTTLDVDLSDFLKAVKDELIEELVDSTLDEDALCRVVSGEEEPSADMQKDVRDSYEALEKFMNKEKLNRRKNARDGDGYIDFREKMQRVEDGKGGMVWVRTENVQKWRDSFSTAAPSR